MLVAWKGHDTVVKRLIELGADIGLSDASWGEQAPHWACKGRRASTLGLLLAAGASFNVRSNDGGTPLMNAAFNGATDCVKLLLARGGDALELDAQNSYGRTALHWAAWQGHSEIVQLLLLAGADPTIRNNHGRTPLDLAQLYNKHSCIALLQAALVEPRRLRLLLEARVLLDAAHATTKAAHDARDKGQPPHMQRQASLAVAPAYLKGRVAAEQALPAVSVMEEQGQENEEKLAACIKYALGLEGGGMVLFEGQEPTVGMGMAKEVFVELCELLVPKWDRTNV